jgi:hypothetical protein
MRYPSQKIYDRAIAVAESRETKRAKLTYSHLSDAAEKRWKEFPFLKKGLHSISNEPS